MIDELRRHAFDQALEAYRAEAKRVSYEKRRKSAAAKSGKMAGKRRTV